jgi:dipeptidyl aminopeptidase/acylaminoacyl peptidase
MSYRRPPPEITEVLDAPPPPAVVVGPTREYLLLVQGVRYPSIDELAAPMLRLAGLRINPETNGPHRTPRYIALAILTIADGRERTVVLPPDGHFSLPSVAADGRRFALTNTTPIGIESWVGDVRTATARPVPGVRINAVHGDALQWLPDNRTLLCQTVLPGQEPPRAKPQAASGPIIQESAGNAAPVRTFQDLLQNRHDEELFDHYATSQLVLIDADSGRVTAFGPPGIFAEIDPSPDGNLFLVSRIRRPYSYLYPITSFPHDIEIWNRTGQVIHTLAQLPLQDQVPIEGVPTGPRNVHWRPTEPDTLVWVEALDDGDPRKKVPHRDRVLTLRAPFADMPQELARVEHRFAGLTWSQDGTALLRDYDRDRRWVRTFRLAVDEPGRPATVVWDRSIHDRYGDPGNALLRTLPNGQRVLWQHGRHIFLAGPGASPDGDRPFLDRFTFDTRQSERLFRCGDRQYEAALALLSDDGLSFLTQHETPTEPPNICVRTAHQEERRSLTRFTDPTPQVRGITKQIVTYQRADGVPLSMTLYLPPGHRPGERLPTVVWAYPLEYNSADTAGQVTGSPYRFTTLAGPTHLFFLLHGYAVLDGATMPVVGDPETANNTFLDQVVASAAAAIETAAGMGVTDRDRVGIGGHSYGAFMAANLLAHSKLFRAGIARSGAYNRTLTPFGFQNERRTLWEASEVYARMSPFQYAHTITAPLLLIHGADDNNPGTFPMQSERMYQAIRGNGGTVRLVLLPHESHGYAARESVEHTLAEMVEWFDKYVKGG